MLRECVKMKKSRSWVWCITNTHSCQLWEMRMWEIFRRSKWGYGNTRGFWRHALRVPKGVQGEGLGVFWDFHFSSPLEIVLYMIKTQSFALFLLLKPVKPVKPKFHFQTNFRQLCNLWILSDCYELSHYLHWNTGALMGRGWAWHTAARKLKRISIAVEYFPAGRSHEWGG